MNAISMDGGAGLALGGAGGAASVAAAAGSPAPGAGAPAGAAGGPVGPAEATTATVSPQGRAALAAESAQAGSPSQSQERPPALDPQTNSIGQDLAELNKMDELLAALIMALLAKEER